MRKFTKEISALLASAAVGATVYAGTVSASPEQIEQTAGVMAIPDETVEPTSEEYFAGGLMADPPEDITEPTEEPTTEEEFPPLGGVPLPPDDVIEPTTEEFPPLAGEPMLPDEFIESTTEEEELPPLAGDVAPADGDINGDGKFGIADVVLLQKWLLSAPDAEIFNWWAADLNYDNRLDVFDLCLMKSKLLEKQITESPITVFGLTQSKTGVDEFIADFPNHKFWNGEDAIFNVTPAEITDKYGFKIFKCSDCFESWLEYKGNVYQLGTGFGGMGTTSFAVADLNRDGYYELYFAYSWGSGLNSAHIDCFDTAISDFVGLYPDSWSRNVGFALKDGRLEVCEISRDKKLGEIVAENGKIVFKSVSSITVFGLTQSKTGVDEFTADFPNHKFWNGEDAISNVTPTEITDKYGFRIFKCGDCFESWLEYKGNVYQLGTGFGGMGTTSFAVADLNRDGYYELYFAYSCGSGLNSAFIDCFDTAISDFVGFAHDHWYEDVAFAVKDGRLEVCEKYSDKKLGEIVAEDGKIVFRSITDQVLSEIISLCADDIDHVTLTAYPPDKSVQLTKEQIDEMLTLLKAVKLYKEDNSYNEYNGQWVQFDITLNSGKEISLAECNPFFIINRNGYKAEYVSCQALSEFANSIIIK